MKKRDYTYRSQYQFWDEVGNGFYWIMLVALLLGLTRFLGNG